MGDDGDVDGVTIGVEDEAGRVGEVLATSMGVEDV